MNIDNIDFYNLGHLNSIYTLCDRDYNGTISKVAFLFEPQLLFVEINEEDDTIKVNVYKDVQSKIKTMKKDSKIESYFYEIVNYQCMWIWTLTNQQGYTDGLQLEFSIKDGDISNDVTTRYTSKNFNTLSLYSIG